jgi:hypothetical protein
MEWGKSTPSLLNRFGPDGRWSNQRSGGRLFRTGAYEHDTSGDAEGCSRGGWMALNQGGCALTHARHFVARDASDTGD